ncbi:MAG: M20/M25/M40 family metallo-hydrolase [Balneolaceae bacterium]|nr:M20/M25/M40 family metallo-hydrolase [Balneolaceae bacterium]
MKAVRRHYQENGSAILQEYRELLAMPNVAADVGNMRKNANWIVEAFERRGVKMELWELEDRPDIPPVVYGELLTPGTERTLIIYVHYDGQPVDPANWTHIPWEPTLYLALMEEEGEPIPFPDSGEPVDPDWRIYGRSAADDKAPIPALLGTLDALQASEIPLTANLKFFFDGEEEIGSPNVRRFLRKHRDKLQGDLWLFCDGPKHQSGRPQVVFGVRGVTGMEITVYGATRSLHSGHYGGWAPVPGQMLAELIATMKDETGRVLVEGFYDSTAPITEADRKAFATLPDYNARIKRELGLVKTEFDGQPLIERYMYPTLTVRGLSSGNVGEKARNVIPSSATAALGIRLAKGNEPAHMQNLVEAHIRKQGYYIVREEPDRETRLKHPKIAKVTQGTGYPAMRTAIDNHAARVAVEGIRQVSEDEIILSPTMGGTLPLFHFQEVLETPLVIVPIANHDNNQHAPNENIRIGNIWYGMRIYSSIFTIN